MAETILMLGMYIVIPICFTTVVITVILSNKLK